MDNEKIYKRSRTQEIVKKYGYEELNSELSWRSDDSWYEYGVERPERVKLPEGIDWSTSYGSGTDGDDGLTQNLSSVEIWPGEADIEWGYDSGTWVGEGSMAGWYVQPGNYVESVSCSPIVGKFLWDGEDITKEQFQEINGMSDEELEFYLDFLCGVAEDDFNEYVEENAEYD